MLKRLAFTLTAIVTMIFIFIAGLEIFATSLRYFHEGRFRDLSDSDKYDLRILTLGESTSAEYFTSEVDSSWPKILESKLRHKYPNQKVKVYNRAATGTNSLILMVDLAKNLEIIKPHIIVGMIGINDLNMAYNVNTYDRKFTIKDLVITKLFLWLASELSPSKTTIDVESELVALNKVPVEEKNMFVFERLKNSSLRKGDYDFYLGFIDYSEGGKITIDDRIEVLRKITNKYPEHFYSTVILAEMYSRKKDFVNCCDVLEKHLEKVGEGRAHKNVIAHYFQCLSSLPERKSKLETMRLSKNLLSSIENSRKNFEWLIDSANDMETRLYLMQYPLVNECKIKAFLEGDLNERYFRSYGHYLRSRLGSDIECDPNREKYHLISNFENFQNILRNNKHNEVFLDQFADVFGHFTKLGHEAIADKVINQINEDIVRILN